MAAGLGNALDKELPDFLAQGGHIRHRQIFYFSGRIDTLQQGIAHIRTSFYTIGITKPSKVPSAAPVKTSIGVWPTISFSFLPWGNCAKP